jgi:hypothetical protein
MSDDEWMPETEPAKRAQVVTIDRRPLSERSKLSDRGLIFAVSAIKWVFSIGKPTLYDRYRRSSDHGGRVRLATDYSENKIRLLLTRCCRPSYGKSQCRWNHPNYRPSKLLSDRDRHRSAGFHGGSPCFHGSFMLQDF